MSSSGSKLSPTVVAAAVTEELAGRSLVELEAGKVPEVNIPDRLSPNELLASTADSIEPGQTDPRAAVAIRAAAVSASEMSTSGSPLREATADHFAGINNVVSPTEFRKRQQSTAVVKPGGVFPAWTSGHGWTVGGANINAGASSTDDTTEYLLGDRSVKIVTGGSGGTAQATKTFAAPIDLTGYDVRIRFKYDDVNLGNVIAQIGNSSFSQVSQKVIFTTGGGSEWPWPRGRWAVIDIPQSHFGAGATWSAIQRFQLQVTDINGSPTTVHFAGLEFVQQDPFSQGPAIAFTFDDSLPAAYSQAFADFTSRGWVGTLYPIVDKLDQASYMTTAQVDEMYDAGWEVGAHTYSNAAHALGYPTMAAASGGAPLRAELEALQAWQDSRGYRPGTLAYPLGQHDAASEAIIREYYSTAMTAFAPMVETMTPARRFAIPRFNVGSQFANLSSYLSACSTAKGLLIMCVHDIRTGGTSNDITPTNWASLLSAVDASGIPVKRLDTLLAGIR